MLKLTKEREDMLLRALAEANSVIDKWQKSQITHKCMKQAYEAAKNEVCVKLLISGEAFEELLGAYANSERDNEAVRLRYRRLWSAYHKLGYEETLTGPDEIVDIFKDVCACIESKASYWSGITAETIPAIYDTVLDGFAKALSSHYNAWSWENDKGLPRFSKEITATALSIIKCSKIKTTAIVNEKEKEKKDDEKKKSTKK